MDLFTYVLKHDGGFAPNPFAGVCTLATCKPVIRKTAGIGDWIAGFGSVSGVGAGRLIYAMRVGLKLPMDLYGVDPAYRVKRPSVSRDWWLSRGDNIYYRDETGEWRQRRGCHGPKDMQKDLSGRYALISDEFYYLGHKAIAIPNGLRNVVTQTQGHRHIRDSSIIKDFVAWVRLHPVGRSGVPWDRRALDAKVTSLGNHKTTRCT